MARVLLMPVNSFQSSASKSTPYVGLVYDIDRHWSAYASHTAIFNPQSETDANGNTLAPVEGKTTEAGLKSAFYNGKLNLSGAVFKTKQDNTAEQADFVGGKAWYRGLNAESKGVEFDLAGELAKGCLLYTSPSPRDLSTSRMPSSA